MNRFRTRREVEKEGNEDYRPTRSAPRFRDTVEDEQPRRFKPLRQREYDEEDYEPRKTARPSRKVEDDYDDEPRRPAQRPTRSYREEDYDDEPRRPARPARREMNDDEKLGAAIRTAEENGFTIRKMSKLDQAKQVARDNGFEIRRIDDADDEAPRRPTRRPVDDTVDSGNDRPARTVPGRAQRPLVRPKTTQNVNDGIRTRTAPDTEIKNDIAPEATPAPTDKTDAPAEPPKKPTYADDFMDRAARFFGEDE